MTFHIRRALSRDVDDLVRFNAALALETEGKALDHQQLRLGVESLLQDAEKGWYIIAEGTRSDSSRQLVGQLLITFEWSDWRNAMFWWIQSLYVEPEHRQQGILRQLYQYVCDQAQASCDPICGVRLYVEKDNRTAQRAYQALGFHEAPYQVYEQEFV